MGDTYDKFHLYWSSELAMGALDRHCRGSGAEETPSYSCQSNETGWLGTATRSRRLPVCMF